MAFKRSAVRSRLAPPKNQRVSDSSLTLFGLSVADPFRFAIPTTLPFRAVIGSIMRLNSRPLEIFEYKLCPFEGASLWSPSG